MKKLHNELNLAKSVNKVCSLFINKLHSELINLHFLSSCLGVECGNLIGQFFLCWSRNKFLKTKFGLSCDPLSNSAPPSNDEALFGCRFKERSKEIQTIKRKIQHFCGVESQFFWLCGLWNDHL